MAESDFDVTAGVSRQILQSQLDRFQDVESSAGPTLQRDSADGITCRAGDQSCATAHASSISRAASTPRAELSLLQLQRQFGNRYVERVISLARQSSEHDDAPSDVERTIEQRRGGGQSLDGGVRRQMETALKADFSGVRVHTDGESNGLNHALSAKAFTTGQDIFFRQGAYDPGSSIGRELLAHELTHVVQQNGAAISRKLSVSQPGDTHEMEAEQTARAIIQQEHSAPSAAAEIDKQDDKDQEPTTAMASRAHDEVQRQQEAVTEDDEKKKHGVMTKRDESSLSLQGEESQENM
jgi:hypothetical protein